MKARTIIGGVSRSTPGRLQPEGSKNHATHTADPKAPTLHIVASNFFGGVDVKN